MKKLLVLIGIVASVAVAQQTINDLTVKDFKVVSTNKGSKPCPLMTETQRNAIASPLNGHCIYNTTTKKLNVYDGTIWNAAGSGVDAWATASIYAVSDLVIESNKIYKCLIAHTSGTFATDLAASKWVEISVGVTSHLSLTDIGTTSHSEIDTDLTRLANTSGTNTGDNSVNTLYSGLATSKQDTLISGTNIKTVNSFSLLGSGDLVVNIPDLTGDVTSSSGVTSYNSIVPTTKGGTGLSTVGSETKVLKVVSGVPAYAEEDRANLLLNPNFEWSTLSDWTCTSGTCTSTNTSGEFSEGLRAIKVALSAQAMNVSQSVSTLSGSTKQHVIGVKYRVPSTMTDFQICTLIAGTEKTCVPSANLILDDSFHSIEIPEVIIAGSTVGIKFKTTSSFTANAYFDAAYIKQGIGSQNLQLDNLFSAQLSSVGVVTSENTNWITGNCTNAGTGIFDCPIVGFSAIPNCWGVRNSGSATSGIPAMFDRTNSSNTSVRFVMNAAGTDVAVPASVACQKSGADYSIASSAVYNSTNSKTIAMQTSFSAQITSTGGVSGENKDWINGNCTNANPTVCTINTGVFTVTPNCTYGVSGSSSNARSLSVYSQSSTSISFWMWATTNGAPILDQNFIINCQKQGVDYENALSPTITASLAGTPKVPGNDGNIDTFSVSYGTTNATTVCSASPCSYLDQIGSAVSSITRSATGIYSLNTIKTYSKIKCSNSGWIPGVGGVLTDGTMSCSSCSSVPFNTRSDTNTSTDTYGIISCVGSY